MVTMVMYVCVCVCLRSIFGSVRTQFIWNNLCQRNLIRPMNTWTVFFGQFQLLYVCACVSDYFCSFPFWQTKYIKSMKLCLIWWQMTMMMMAVMVMVMATADVLPIITAMTMVWWWCWWMNEWKKTHWKNQEIIPFLSGLHLVSFFFRDIVFCWHNKYFVRVVFAFIYIFGPNKKWESSVLFSIIYFYSMILSWWVCIQYLYKYLFVHFYGVYTDTHRSKQLRIW